MKPRWLVIAAAVLAAAPLGARADEALECHAFSDPPGDTLSPAIDILSTSIRTVDEQVVATITVADLSAALAPGADAAEYLVGWYPQRSATQERVIYATHAEGAWRFEGNIGAPVVGDVAEDTIRMTVPSAHVADGSNRVLQDVNSLTTAYRTIGDPGSGISIDRDGLNGGHPIGIDAACREAASTDTPACPILIDTGGDLRRRFLGHPLFPSPQELDVDLLGVTLESEAGRLVFRLRLSDLAAPRATESDYLVRWWVDDDDYHLTAIRDQSGWRFEGSGPNGALAVTGTPFIADDLIALSLSLDSVPGAMAGRALGLFLVEAFTMSALPASPDDVWDESPDDLDGGGWFVAGGGCAPDPVEEE